MYVYVYVYNVYVCIYVYSYMYVFRDHPMKHGKSPARAPPTRTDR